MTENNDLLLATTHSCGHGADSTAKRAGVIIKEASGPSQSSLSSAVVFGTHTPPVVGEMTKGWLRPRTWTSSVVYQFTLGLVSARVHSPVVAALVVGFLVPAGPESVWYHYKVTNYTYREGRRRGWPAARFLVGVSMSKARENVHLASHNSEHGMCLTVLESGQYVCRQKGPGKTRSILHL